MSTSVAARKSSAKLSTGSASAQQQVPLPMQPAPPGPYKAVTVMLPPPQSDPRAAAPGRRHYRLVRSRMPVLSGSVFDAVFVRADSELAGWG
jgi:hypothetical protein